MTDNTKRPGAGDAPGDGKAKDAEALNMAISVVIPALNEQGNIGRLVEETFEVVPDHVLAEVIVVDDGSTDGTVAEVKALIPRFSKLRYLRHDARSGQSAALRSGVIAACAPVIATMDGDGQNDPADIPKLLERLGAPADGGPALVGGIRVKRKAVGSRRFASYWGNRARAFVLKDDCPDSGCGIKVFRRDVFLLLPFFTSMHRFLPMLFLTYGQRLDFAPVNDRPRLVGQSKYTNIGRLLISIYDMIGVVWLRRRTKTPKITEDIGRSEETQKAGAAPAGSESAKDGVDQLSAHRQARSAGLMT